MARRRSKGEAEGSPTSTFKVGGIALVFLLIGYQSALFVHRAAELRIQSLRDRPDTVFVVDEALAARLLAEESGQGEKREGAWARPTVGPLADCNSGERPQPPERPCPDSSGIDFASKVLRGGRNTSGSGSVIIRRNASHSESVERVRRATRRVESFRFNPNTVSVEDLIRLGFSEKQALAIESYRTRGGRFRRASDFARSYVVADSVFRRLEPFIDIPKLDINRADSAAFDGLPGIGPYFAAKMVEYRTRLGGYSYKEQLMDLRNFDRERFDGLSDLISCSPPAPFRLWSLPEDSLSLHPYIRSRRAAHSIVLFRDNTPPEQCTVQALEAAGILPPEDASRLARCRLEPPSNTSN